MGETMGILSRLKTEFIYLRAALRTLKRTTKVAKNKNYTFSHMMVDLAAEHGERPALISTDTTMSYNQLNARANQYTRWAQAQGVKKGDCVALLMPNKPEYVAAWLGIIRAGGICALLNTNLTGASLAHCINIVTPKACIIDAELADAYEGTTSHLDGDINPWIYGSDGSFPRLDKALDGISDAPLSGGEIVPLTTGDKALYIYTSGTTGLPKAANIIHYRVMAIMNAFAAATESSSNDRMYVCLPLYHTAGGIMAIGIVLTMGGSVFIRDKFSATHFWDDIADNNCTMFQYIGELCRYLLNSPPHPKEAKHKIRLVDGNGLRPDIWEEFQTRFKIPFILEWYASTEGNTVFFNFDQKVGAIGRLPKWAEKKFVTEIVKFDQDTEMPVRGADGYLVKCAPNEIGEAISQILNDPSKPAQRFEGYADKVATEKKIIRGAFEEGDAWFRSGDLIRKDEMGYFYFIDRIGDTFRWKGENVATSEVSEAITVFSGVKEANVYGVEIKGMDGRAGMVSLVVDDDFDLAKFHAHIYAELADYARPLFIRIQEEMEATGTFKQRKVDLVKEGFNPDKINDKLYFNKPKEGSFIAINQELYQRIENGEFRL
ncbi:MAG: long-chain-acyl-CoA synthetase [Hyphomicrobiales bacterium]